MSAYYESFLNMFNGNESVAFPVFAFAVIFGSILFYIRKARMKSNGSTSGIDTKSTFYILVVCIFCWILAVLLNNFLLSEERSHQMEIDKFTNESNEFHKSLQNR